MLCIWKSTQLRKKLCYFLILVLSCTDLIVLTINHPLLIFLTVDWSLGDHSLFLNHYEIYVSAVKTCFGITLSVLLIMTMERFLALMYPFRHKTSVTKRRIMYFLVVTQILSFVTRIFSVKFKILYRDPILLTFLFVVLIFVNYKLFKIARSRNSNDALRANQKTQDVKKCYSCLFIIGSNFLFAFPSVSFNILESTETMNMRNGSLISFFLWASTLLCINSTVNSVIFFWSNNNLRSEGKKVVSVCRSL